MKLNCKVGDLAVIKRGVNANHIFEILAPGGTFQGRHLWEVRTATPLPLFGGGRRSQRMPPSCDGLALDDNLRPIGGVPVTDDMHDEVTA